MFSVDAVLAEISHKNVGLTQWVGSFNVRSIIEVD